jgi:uncharacterized protein (TIGR03067 family)
MIPAAHSRSALAAILIGALVGNLAQGQAPNSRATQALVQQLGDEAFARREAAQSALLQLGEAAVSRLQQAIAENADPEIRWRSRQIVQDVLGRIREAATQKALEELQGSWTLVYSEAGGRQTGGENKSYIFAFQGDKWSIHAGGRLSQGGTVTRIEAKEKLNAIDLAITEGANIGVTAISVYAVEGDTLKYINSGEPRATEFATRPGDGRGYSIFRRATSEP